MSKYPTKEQLEKSTDNQLRDYLKQFDCYYDENQQFESSYYIEDLPIVELLSILDQFHPESKITTLSSKIHIREPSKGFIRDEVINLLDEHIQYLIVSEDEEKNRKEKVEQIKRKRELAQLKRLKAKYEESK